MKTQLTQLLGEFYDLPILSTAPKKELYNNILEPNFDWLVNLIERIKEVISSPCNMPTPPEFSYELAVEAALHNIAILSKYNFNLR
jgi:hypothetical protein